MLPSFVNLPIGADFDDIPPEMRKLIFEFLGSPKTIEYNSQDRNEITVKLTDDDKGHVFSAILKADFTGEYSLDNSSKENQKNVDEGAATLTFKILESTQAGERLGSMQKFVKKTEDMLFLKRYGNGEWVLKIDLHSQESRNKASDLISQTFPEIYSLLFDKLLQLHEDRIRNEKKYDWCANDTLCKQNEKILENLKKTVSFSSISNLFRARINS